MTHTVVVRPKAEEDVYLAAQWYEEQRSGLGSLFAQAITSLIDRIADNPAAFPIIRNGMKRAVVRQFPFAIYFRLDGDQVVIIAVLHVRRHPARWQTRH